MNINILFPEQKKLDDHIKEKHNLQGQDLLKKKTVALICELYETVNESRFFKFWKENPKPRTESICSNCEGEGGWANDAGFHPCEKCWGIGIYGNPLLEEYVDTIHFALSIANDLDYTEHKYYNPGDLDLNDLTIGLTNMITLIPEAQHQRHISLVFNFLIKLGYQLGFTEKDVIQAYYDKNQINHERQLNGY